MAKENVLKRIGDYIRTQFSTEEQAIINEMSTTPASTVTVKMTEVKSADGVKTFSVEGELAVDAMISEVTENGIVPLTTGDYDLEDGTKISVVDGKVTSVVKAEAPAPTMEADMKALEQRVATQMSAHKSELDSVKKENENLKKVIVTLSKQMEEIKMAEIGGKIGEVEEEDLTKIPYDKMTNLQKLKFNRQYK
jgi:hypothetical protein